MRIRFERGVLDTGTRRWTSSTGITAELTELEAELLAYLAARPDRPVSRDELLTEVWGYAPGVTSRAPDHTVRRLRKKIEADPSSPQVIESVYGAGYRAVGVLVDPPELESSPVAPTELVGRDQDLVAVERLLEEPGLVTLRGPGGVGKTALARQILARRRGWFVSLADATSVGELLTSTSLVLGVPLSDRDAEASAARLAESLRAQGEMLLVLDNMEQLDAAAVVEEWLDRAPDLRVLATSRRPLEVAGERVHVVRPLSEAQGVELLAARAGSRFPASERRVLEQLVGALDGLPLAIELAAARLGMVTPEELLERLEASLHIVRALRPNERPLRHRGLLASLEWSWSLLGDAQRGALATLTVCPADFDLSMAEAVLGDVNALDHIDELVLASLLVQNTEGRLHMYASVRAFAASKLDTDERARAEGRRRRYLLGRLPAERAWVLGERVALEQAVRRGVETAPDEAGRLAHALFALRGSLPVSRLLEILELAREAVSDERLRVQLGLDQAAVRRTRGLPVEEGPLRALSSDAEDHPAVRRRAHRILGGWLRSQGRNAEARALYEEALASARSDEDVLEEAHILDALGLLASNEGDFSEAAGQHVEALARYREAEDAAGEIRALGNLGKCLRVLGRHPGAEEALQEALELARAHEYRLMEAVLLTNLANHAVQQGRAAAAEERFLEAVAMQRRLGSQKGTAMSLGSLVPLKLLNDDPMEAEAYALEATRLLRGTGDVRVLGWAQSLAGLAALRAGRPGTAVERIREALATLEGTRAGHLVPAVRAVGAAALVLDGQPERASALLEDLELPAAQVAAALLEEEPREALARRAGSDEQLAAWMEDETARMLAPLLDR